MLNKNSKVAENLHDFTPGNIWRLKRKHTVKETGTVAPSVEIGAGPGQRISMEILGYHGSLLLVLKYSNMSRTINCNQ